VAGSPQPRAMGGQAVMEGVMMRGERTWAVAVRTLDGDIDVEVHDAPTWAQRWSKVPLVRGVMTLAESLALGFKALSWSANKQVPEEERLSPKAIGWTMGVALLFFTGIFILLPAFGARGLNRWLPLEGFWLHAAEGALRLALFIGYILLVGRLADIRRVFQFHGAEHKTIAAYENGVEVTPESAQRFTTEHVRCGTNFLLTVMLITIVVYAFFGRPALPMLIASRVLLIPLIAGISYEIIRFAARHMDSRWMRIAMRPGLALQRLTTRQPSLDQLEVAIVSLKAVLTAVQLAEVEARRARPAPAALPAFRGAV